MINFTVDYKHLALAWLSSDISHFPSPPSKVQYTSFHWRTYFKTSDYIVSFIKTNLLRKPSLTPLPHIHNFDTVLQCRFVTILSQDQLSACRWNWRLVLSYHQLSHIYCSSCCRKTGLFGNFRHDGVQCTSLVQLCTTTVQGDGLSSRGRKLLVEGLEGSRTIGPTSWQPSQVYLVAIHLRCSDHTYSFPPSKHRMTFFSNSSSYDWMRSDPTIQRCRWEEGSEVTRGRAMLWPGRGIRESFWCGHKSA